MAHTQHGTRPDDDPAPDEHGPLRPLTPRLPDLAVTSGSPQPGVHVLAVAGEVDLATATQLEDAVAPVLDGPGLVVLDLSGVTFLASSGLGVLLDAHQRTGGRLRVIVTHAAVRRALEISGVLAVLRCHPSVADALTAP